MTKDELDIIRELNVSDQEKLQVFKETKFKELEEETKQKQEETKQKQEETNQVREQEETKRLEIEYKTFQVRIENNTSRLNTVCECVSGCIDDYIEYKNSEEAKKREQEQEEMMNQLDFLGLSDENKPAFKVG